MVKTKSFGGRDMSVEIVFRGYVLQVALVSDLLNLNEVFPNEDDVIETPMSNAGMEDELDDWSPNNSFRQNARP